MLILRYDPIAFPFREVIQSYFDSSSLEHLHLSRVSLTRSENDQGSPAHTTVYKQLDDKFFDLYKRFAKDMKKVVEPGEWLYQKVPTFRFQFPHESATREFHRDRDYAHVPQTVNIVVPLTKMVKSTAIQVEAAPYVRRMMESMDMDLGEFCIFDGANRKHGTLPNREGYTRVSFDFRLLQRQYLPTDTVTVNRKLGFADYYEPLV